jgi:hypothetical protein
MMEQLNSASIDRTGATEHHREVAGGRYHAQRHDGRSEFLVG